MEKGQVQQNVELLIKSAEDEDGQSESGDDNTLVGMVIRDYHAFWVMNLTDKLMYIVELPLWLARRFSIPLIEEEYWSRQIASFSWIPGILFFAFNCTGGDLGAAISSSVAIPVWAIALPVSILMAVVTYCKRLGVLELRCVASLRL